MSHEAAIDRVAAQIAHMLHGALTETERAAREAEAKEAVAALVRGRSPAVAAAAGDSLLLSTNDAAAFLRQSPRTLTNWRQLGTGPRYVKHGPRRVSYRLADLKAYVAERVTEPAWQKLARQSPELV